MCTRPLIRAETYETFRNQKGGISYKAEFLDRLSYDDTKFEQLQKAGKYRKVDVIGCGQCHECILAKSRNDATKIMLEKQYGYTRDEGTKEEPKEVHYDYADNECWFITLTYDDAHLHTHTYIDTYTGEVHRGVSLNKDDIQNFVKQCRNYFPNKCIRYMQCGEYGKSTHRPHHHIIIFGLPLDELQFKKIHMNKLGQPTFIDKEVVKDKKTGKIVPLFQKLWPHGNHEIGRVTWRSAAYVARYTLKKAFGEDKDWYILQGKIPEWVSMSDNLGIEYYKQKGNEVWETDCVPISTPSNGNLCKPPKRWERLLEEADPELYKMLKDSRKLKQEAAEAGKRLLTDMTPEERRKADEERMMSVFKDIRMEV